MSSSWLNELEACAWLDISPRRFRRLCATGVVEARRRNRQWFTRWDWIETYLLSGDRNSPVRSIEEILSGN